MGFVRAPVVAANIWSPFGTDIQSVKVKSVKFLGNHMIMADNNSSWEPSTKAFPTPPEWQLNGPNTPLSISLGKPVKIDVTLEVSPSDADETECLISGTTPSGWNLNFDTSTKLKGGTQTLTLASKQSLPTSVTKLTQSIDWQVFPNKGTFKGGSSAGSSGPHTLYITFDTPISPPGREAGLTQKRMEAAVKWLGMVGETDPMKIVEGISSRLPSYTLVTNPAVPKDLDHPRYFNDKGGVWWMDDFIKMKAQCQAMVRFIRAIIKHVGCPGDAKVMVVYADPDVNGGAKVLESDFEGPAPPPGQPDPRDGCAKTKVVGGKTWTAWMMDRDPGQVGSVFDLSDITRPDYMGLNHYEACMKFTHKGVSRYFPGGGGGSSVDAMEPIIYVFYALCWVSTFVDKNGNDKARIEQIVKRYRDKSGNTLPL